MTLRELMEKRAALVAKMRALNDAPSGEGGDLSEAQSTHFAEYRADLEKTEKAIERQRLIDEADRRASGERVGGDADRDFEREQRSFSLTRAMAAAAGLDVDAGREREISQELARRTGKPAKGFYAPLSVFERRATPSEMERRVLTTAAPVGGPGSNIISEDFRGDMFIDLLRSALVTSRLGARILSGLVGNVAIPKQTVSAGSAWIAENAAITPSDSEYGQVTMAPKHCGVIEEYSRNLLLQSTPDIEQLIRADFAASLARAIDSAALSGGGSNEPTGILATAGVDKTTSFATPAWARVLDLIDIVESNNALTGSLGFAMSPNTKKQLRSTVRVASTDSRFIMEDPNTLAGYPAATSTGVPINTTPDPDTGQIIFGNWSDLIIGYWSVLDILVNPYESTAYSKGNVQIRGMLTADVALRHDESFAAATDVPIA